MRHAQTNCSQFFIHGLLEFSCYDQVEKKFDSEIMVCQMYIPWLIMLKALCHYKAKVELLNIAMGFVGGMWLTTTKSLLAHTAD